MEYLQKVFSGKRLLAYWGVEVIREDRWSFELEPLSSTDLLVGGLFPVSLDEKRRLVTCQGKDKKYVIRQDDVIQKMKSNFKSTW